MKATIGQRISMLNTVLATLRMFSENLVFFSNKSIDLIVDQECYFSRDDIYLTSCSGTSECIAPSHVLVYILKFNKLEFLQLTETSNYMLFLLIISGNILVPSLKCKRYQVIKVTVVCLFFK